MCPPKLMRLDVVFVLFNIMSLVANMEDGMPYREKFTWLTLAALVVSFGFYFAVAYSGTIEGMPNFRLLIVYAAAMALQLVILGVGTLVIRAGSGPEAKAKPDERDRAITRLGASRAYYVMMAGLVFTGVYLPFTNAGWHIVHAALATYVVSEIARSAVVIRAYRSGWHG